MSDSKKVGPEMSLVVQITMSLDSALASHRSAEISANVMPPMKNTTVTLGFSAAAPARAAAAAGMACSSSNSGPAMGRRSSSQARRL
jgi:hypothetical protein